MKLFKIMLWLAASIALAGACNAAKFGGKKSAAPGPGLQPTPCEGKDCPTPGTPPPADKPGASDPSKDPKVCEQERAKCETNECREQWKACEPQDPNQNDDGNHPGQHDLPSQHDIPSQRR